MRRRVSIQYRIARFRDKLYTRALLIATPELAPEELISFGEPLETSRGFGVRILVWVDK